MKRFLVFIAILPILVSTSISQSYPNKSASVGFQITQGEYGYGPVINYALNEDVHIGTQLGLYFDGGTDRLASNFFLYFAPYAKYYFKNIKNFRPFVQGQFALYTVQNYVNDRDVNVSPSQVGESAARYDGTSIWINVGGTWFPFNNIGISAGMRFLDFETDRSWLKVGLGNPFIAIDWYLN